MDAAEVVNEQAEQWGIALGFKDTDKRRFAEGLIRYPNEPMQAAIFAFGPGKEDTGRVSYAAVYWPKHPEVIAYTQELLSKGSIKHAIPTKEEVARRVWEWAQAPGLDIEERVKAAKLLCEIQDYIPKPGTQVNVTTNLRVMEVPTSKSDVDWEKETLAQQKRLSADALADALSPGEVVH